MSIFRDALVYLRYIKLHEIIDKHSINTNKIEKEISILGDMLDNVYSDQHIENYIDLADKINSEVDQLVDNLKFNISEANNVILNISKLMKINNLTEEELVEKDLLSYEILSLHDRYYIGI